MTERLDRSAAAPPRPRAFRLDTPPTASTPPASPPSAGPAVAAAPPRDPGIVIVEEPLGAIEAADGVPVIVPRRRRAPWVGMFMSALGGLAALGIGLGVERLVADLFAAAPWLGWLAVGLAALAGLSLAAIVARELKGVLNERRIERLRMSAVEALAVRDHEAAKAVACEVAGLYGDGAAAGRGPSVLSVADEIMDADDRLALAERTLVAPRDAEATRAIAAAAKRVSVVTALSPRAIVDVAFVVYAAAGLLRRIARIYGGRPGLLGFLRLAGAALNHLAVTGSVAVGDSLLQQALGLGLAARVSAKLGEGVLNGLMTARFGLAALEVCRPLPFIRETPPRIADVAGDLWSGEAPPTA